MLAVGGRRKETGNCPLPSLVPMSPLSVDFSDPLSLPFLPKLPSQPASPVPRGWL